MGKHSITSRLVKCPICGVEVKSRGLHAHLRLVHPNSDIQKELRKKIMSPNAVGEVVKFQISQLPNGSLKIKWANINRHLIETIYEICDNWLIDGHPMNSQHWDTNYLEVDQNSIGEGIIESDEE